MNTIMTWPATKEEMEEEQKKRVEEMKKKQEQQIEKIKEAKVMIERQQLVWASKEGAGKTISPREYGIFVQKIASLKNLSTMEAIKAIPYPKSIKIKLSPGFKRVEITTRRMFTTFSPASSKKNLTGGLRNVLSQKNILGKKAVINKVNRSTDSKSVVSNKHKGLQKKGARRKNKRTIKETKKPVPVSAPVTSKRGYYISIVSPTERIRKIVERIGK